MCAAPTNHRTPAKGKEERNTRLTQNENRIRLLESGKQTREQRESGEMRELRAAPTKQLVRIDHQQHEQANVLRSIGDSNVFVGRKRSVATYPLMGPMIEQCTNTLLPCETSTTNAALLTQKRVTPVTHKGEVKKTQNRQ